MRRSATGSAGRRVSGSWTGHLRIRWDSARVALRPAAGPAASGDASSHAPPRRRTGRERGRVFARATPPRMAGRIAIFCHVAAAASPPRAAASRTPSTSRRMADRTVTSAPFSASIFDGRPGRLASSRAATRAPLGRPRALRRQRPRTPLAMPASFAAAVSASQRGMPRAIRPSARRTAASLLRGPCRVDPH